MVEWWLDPPTISYKDYIELLELYIYQNHLNRQDSYLRLYNDSERSDIIRTGLSLNIAVVRESYSIEVSPR
jgi:hypothetical protein